MKAVPAIAIVGDRDDRIAAHIAIPRALEAARMATGAEVGWRWLGSEEAATASLADFAGFWLTPGSPYRSVEGALAVARFAREQGIPFLGSCGGFQHALLEFARHVAGLPGADHAETNATASVPVIAPLNCALVEVTDRVRFVSGSRLEVAYGTTEATEGYHCRYGLNENYRAALESAGFWFTAFDGAGSARGGELIGHPFFVGTLFQSERRALRGERVPMAEAFILAVTGKKSEPNCDL